MKGEEEEEGWWSMKGEEEEEDDALLLATSPIGIYEQIDLDLKGGEGKLQWKGLCTESELRIKSRWMQARGDFNIHVRESVKLW